MSNNKAFVKKVEVFGSGQDEDGLVHQSSPAWVLTFIRWEIRDTLRTDDSTDTSSKSVRDPLVVENDCLQASVTVGKGTLTPSLSATLVQTDVNYMTAVAPGDFVFVNMLNWDSEARRVADNARDRNPINGPDDGFKGLFKVQSVRKVVSVNPGTGTKIVLFKLTGYAFTEFNNTIYFNPYLIDVSEKNFKLYVTNIGNDWALMVSKKGLTNVQDIIKTLIESFIGSGIQDDSKLPSLGIVKSPNVHFFMPDLIGSLLGINGVRAAKDIYTYLFGVQQYSSGFGQSLADGMNPDNSVKEGRFLYTGEHCKGETVLKTEYWNQVKTWSVLNQFTNSPLNELYTCFRISPNNRVMPTVVFRQIPFTTDDFTDSDLPVTKFMTVPRWKISPSMVLSLDIGRDEAGRINFVQYFGKSTFGPDGFDIQTQIAQGNYLYDEADVERSGLRPYVVMVQFDELTKNKENLQATDWAKIVGNSLIGGHLKLNGTIECIGIVDPIAVGDNLEFDGVVFHIEQITHSCGIMPNSGMKTFRTIISISSGVSKRSDDTSLSYSEMVFPSAYAFRDDDFNNNQVLPGISESQDVTYRSGLDRTGKETNDPFLQPTSGASESDGDDTKGE